MARILSSPSPQDSNSNMVCFLILSARRRPTQYPLPQQTPDLSKRNKYWWRVIGRVLSTLLTRSSYSQETTARYDDFFKSLGIDSLQALDLLTKLEQHFKIELPDYELQGVSDFRTLASRIQTRL